MPLFKLTERHAIAARLDPRSITPAHVKKKKVSHAVTFPSSFRLLNRVSINCRLTAFIDGQQQHGVLKRVFLARRFRRATLYSSRTSPAAALYSSDDMYVANEINR